MRIFFLSLAIFAIVACSPDEEAVQQTEPVDISHDYFSFANTDQFVTGHVKLDLTVDFDLKELRGRF